MFISLLVYSSFSFFCLSIIIVKCLLDLFSQPNICRPIQFENSRVYWNNQFVRFFSVAPTEITQASPTRPSASIIFHFDCSLSARIRTRTSDMFAHFNFLFPRTHYSLLSARISHPNLHVRWFSCWEIFGWPLFSVAYIILSAVVLVRCHAHISRLIWLLALQSTFLICYKKKKCLTQFTDNDIVYFITLSKYFDEK